jgi:hypothetical protein
MKAAVKLSHTNFKNVAHVRYAHKNRNVVIKGEAKGKIFAVKKKNLKKK